jgi:electron transfer flavoprotein beta subunit
MKILVPIKRVPDPYAVVRPLPDGSGIDANGLKHEINPFDEIALEEAVRMKEADPAIHITAVSMGGPECEEQLRKALAMGADLALRIDCSDAVDSSVVSAELAALAQAESPDLILMGKQATDFDSGQAAQMTAARLGWPQAMYAARIERDGSRLTVVRETDEGEETVALSLPAIVTADLRLNEPRYIPLPGIIRARTKPLEVRARLTTAAPKTRLTRLVDAPARAAGIMVDSVDALVAELQKRGALA